MVGKTNAEEIVKWMGRSLFTWLHSQVRLLNGTWVAGARIKVQFLWIEFTDKLTALLYPQVQMSNGGKERFRGPCFSVKH